ncbi:MAG TPA: alpha/beta hydrolase [Actinomycetota bacterium]|nr:alpha/beta hydrolase [Actinomycetota bacterium]
MVRANGIELGHDEAGAGPPLVFVHGSWSDRRSWDAVFPRFATAGFRAIRYDRRGHGLSDQVPGTLDDDADDLAGLIEALGASPAHVVGSSRGGAIALKLAAVLPEVFRTLTCHEPPLPKIVPANDPARPELERVLLGERAVCDLISNGDHEAAARLFVEEVAFGEGGWTKLPERVRDSFVAHAETFLEECQDPSATTVDLGALGRFDRPVLLTRGERSQLWYASVVRALAGALPSVITHVYRGAGHVPQATLVGTYVRTLTAFLASADAGEEPDLGAEQLRRDEEHLSEDHEDAD